MSGINGIDWKRCYAELSEDFPSISGEVNALFSSNGTACSVRLDRAPPRITVSYAAIGKDDSRITPLALGVSAIAEAHRLRAYGTSELMEMAYVLKPDYRRFPSRPNAA